jgi:hypothetical protein
MLPLHGWGQPAALAAGNAPSAAARRGNVRASNAVATNSTLANQNGAAWLRS